MLWSNVTNTHLHKYTLAHIHTGIIAWRQWLFSWDRAPLSSVWHSDGHPPF